MKIFFRILLLTVAVALILLSPSVQQFSIGSVCAKNSCFQVKLAKTEAQKEKGLMGVSFLDKDKGMLFVFEKEGIYPFWMKNTLIPLDIIWIGGDKKVVFIGQNIEPCKSLICPPIVPPGPGAKYVLEINAGMAKEIGLEVGDELKITP